MNRVRYQHKISWQPWELSTVTVTFCRLGAASSESSCPTSFQAQISGDIVLRKLHEAGYRSDRSFQLIVPSS
jgi:hypothetical protein